MSARYAFKDRDGKALFHALRSHDFFGYENVIEQAYDIFHLDGLRWSGLDVTTDKEVFRTCVHSHSVEIFEYLLKDQGMCIEFVMANFGDYVREDMLEMFLRVKGIEEVERIPQHLIRFRWGCTKLLSFYGYRFDIKNLLESSLDAFEIYALMCFNVFAYRDLNDEQKAKFQKYVSRHDIKACPMMVPFMKDIRKKKILTVILCFRKMLRMPKELIWKILDHCYSPKQQITW